MVPHRQSVGAQASASAARCHFLTQVLMNENFGAGYGSDCSCKSSSSVNQE